MIPNSYQYRDCRGMLRHAWHEVPSDWAEASPLLGQPFTVRCERCDTERRDIIGDNTGELVSRRYVYPHGYHIDKTDAGLPNITDFRVAWLEDLIERQKAERSKRQARKRIGRGS